MNNKSPLVQAQVLSALPEHRYGNSFAQLRLRRPDSILTRLYDKYLRLESLLDQPDAAKVKDESVEDTLRDLANYCIMELIERKLEHEALSSLGVKGVAQNEQ